MNFTELISKRRSVYALGKSLPKDEASINKLVSDCVSQCPSAFNSQSSKAVILYGKNHDDLWDLLQNKMKQLLPAEALEETLGKIGAFKAAYGTILFYENQEVVGDLEANFPRYAHNFQPWSQQSSGMLQFAVWAGLSELNIGANIQHYNELIEEDLYAMFDIEKKYKLVSQMPFGNIVQGAQDKSIDNLDERFCVKA